MPKEKFSLKKIIENPRLFFTLTLMFGSAFPAPLTSSGTTFQVWLTRNNVDLKAIGLLTLVGIPYNLKILWAPLLDRFSMGVLGRRRGWILFFQLCLVPVIALMGAIDPYNNITLIVVFATMIAFLNASSDIVIDAYRVDLLRKEEIPYGAAAIQLGSRIAFLTTGGLALVLSDHYPWSTVFYFMSFCGFVGAVSAYFAPEPKTETQPPQSIREAVVKPLGQFFSREGATEILLFVIFYKLADALASALLSNFLISRGFTNTELATAYKVFGMISTVVGSVAASTVIQRIGTLRALWFFGVLQAVSNFVFVGLAYSGKSYWWMIGAICVENFTGGMGTVAFLAFLIGICDERFSATQYALLTSLMILARTFMAAPTGYIVEQIGWGHFYLGTVFTAIPGLLLLHRLRRYSISLR